MIVPLALLVVTAAAIVAATIAANGNLLAAVTPIAVVAALWGVWVAPLRKTLLPVFFLGLALDKPGDAAGFWQSPVAPIGGLLIANLNKTVDIPALTVSLLMIVLAYLALVRLRRLCADPQVIEPGSRSFASPMKWALGVSFLTAVALTAYGVARGGTVQMAKIQLQVFIPLLLMAYLLGVSLRGGRDYQLLGKLVLAAACVKAAMAFWVRLTAPVVFGQGPGQLPYLTTHGDSMLFVCAMAILVAAFFERPTNRNRRWLIALMPVLIAAVIVNNRRLAWVQLAAACLLVVAMNPRRPAIRTVWRACVYALPLALLYGAAGWNSGSRVFRPVHFLRSMTDSTMDRSTLYRDGENYNLIYTLRQNPLLGTGFGQPFEYIQPLDDISTGFKEWRYLPHNAMLGLWAFTGVIGFSGVWLALIVGLLLAARSYRCARQPDDRAASLAVIASIAVYAIHCWGDIGFTEPKSIFLVGAGLAVAGQLAVSTGAWPAASRGALVHLGRAFEESAGHERP